MRVGGQRGKNWERSEGRRTRRKYPSLSANKLPPLRSAQLLPEFSPCALGCYFLSPPPFPSLLLCSAVNYPDIFCPSPFCCALSGASTYIMSAPFSYYPVTSWGLTRNTRLSFPFYQALAFSNLTTDKVVPEKEAPYWLTHTCYVYFELLKWMRRKS